jgi:hypothetical protein
MLLGVKGLIIFSTHTWGAIPASIKKTTKNLHGINHWLTTGIKASCKRKRELFHLYTLNDTNLKMSYKRYCKIFCNVTFSVKKLHYNRMTNSENMHGNITTPQPPPQKATQSRPIRTAGCKLEECPAYILFRSLTQDKRARPPPINSQCK